ncbi:MULTISPECIES: HNH endonuclease [Amycolatopsis]|uniref:HNH endonuclease n=2 Tax=Amycolatopsis TaxID=1813 RepID=A0ABP8VI15_9PSEU|nr:HNH endonuclease [Amycolatopsis sacchari]SFJ90068.1 putative restriction endonuclease [Amycolatopsis sacchari]
MDLLQEAVEASPDGSLTRDELTRFEVDGQHLSLLDRNRGIRNPKDLLATLSIMSSDVSSYQDGPQENGLYSYAYRSGTEFGDNTKLRRAYELELPIIFLAKITTGRYVPAFPAYVVADERAMQRFYISFDPDLRLDDTKQDLTDAEKRYSRRVARQRLHQPAFRATVLRAYETRCAACDLPYRNLLDAAHIIADGEDDGAPVISNGLSLCKLHHAAYDNEQLGISPDYTIHIARVVLEDEGGPMLQYGLQKLHEQQIRLPHSRNDRPDPDRLQRRFERFLKSG